MQGSRIGKVFLMIKIGPEFMHEFCMHEVPMPTMLVMDQHVDGGAADDEGAACDTVCAGNAAATGDGRAGGHVGPPLITL
jgi:hypothetical protein